MKKIGLFLTGLMLSMAVSCIEESFENSSSDKLIITGSLVPETKTTFIEGDGVIETHWNENDRIGIFTEDQKNLEYATRQSGRGSEFRNCTANTLNYEEGKTVYAYYPYMLDQFVIGDSIPIIESRSNKPFLYSKAQIKNGRLDFHFKHLFAYLKLTLSVEDLREHCFTLQEQLGDEYELDFQTGRISIRSLTKFTTLGSYFDITSEENEQSAYDDKIEFDFKKYLDLSSDDVETVIFPIVPLPQDAGVQVIISFKDKKSRQYVNSRYAFNRKISEGFKAGCVYNCDISSERLKNKSKEIRALLESFYHKTDGDNWFDNKNWLSDKPISEWGRLNTFRQYRNTDILHEFSLENNRLKGEFPSEILPILDMMEIYDSQGMNDDMIFGLSGNLLYGKIPDEVKNHRLWNRIGWNLFNQILTPEGEIDYSDSRLYIENTKVEDFIEDGAQVKDLYDIFRENKLTQIINLAMPCHSPLLIRAFNEDLVNSHLDYANKGLKTLFYVGEAEKEKETQFKDDIKKLYGNVDGISWIRGENKRALNQSRYFFDSNGQLVHIAFQLPTCGSEEVKEETKLANDRRDSFLRSVLGEPEEHPKFSMEFEMSKDFSRDGEVLTLQTAKKNAQANSIIFIGDGFIDTEMQEGGIYEMVMKEAMEEFFSYEPYKSYRDRFNVYTVKAVSGNILDYSTWAIRNSPQKCFKYVDKIPHGEDFLPTVAVVFSTPIFDDRMDRSYCVLYSDESSVSFLYYGIHQPDVLMHEVGGHGFAGLMDEYVEERNKGLDLPSDIRKKMDNDWTKYGRGANVDWRNDSSTVKWSHFLEDSRYENEGLGIYEGAYLYSFGAYRPSMNSMMRYNDGPFNAPSREQIYKRIMQRSEGDDWKYDYEEFVKYDEINRTHATRSATKPVTESERREYIENHRPPTIVKGTWRDALKGNNSDF